MFITSLFVSFEYVVGCSQVFYTMYEPLFRPISLHTLVYIDQALLET